MLAIHFDMGSTDSDGPPPLAGSGSDSDGPPPLVDSSSGDEVNAVNADGTRRQADVESQESSEPDDDQDFANLFQMSDQQPYLVRKRSASTSRRT